jgi:hypothetical protein
VWLADAVIAFALAVAGQVLLRWMMPTRDAVASFLAWGVIVGCGLMVGLFELNGAQVAVAGALLYGFLCELYIFAFTFAAISISANLLLVLQAGPMDQNEIDRLYDDREMVRKRIAGLTRNGLVERVDGELRATRTGKRLAEVFNGARRFFRHS